jgi:hypothetical protein
MKSLLFLVHDYLHAWGYLAIRDLMPALGFGSAPITPENFESFVFCHLVTEAVATVGLDYWYLSTVDLEDVVPIGTCHHLLTVDYHDRHWSEYSRLRPGFSAQHPSFFHNIVECYCSGLLRGFDKADLSKSPRLKAWLGHELTYSKLQRRYARQWFAYLAGDRVSYASAEAPAAMDAEWQEALVEQLGELLWDKVKNGAMDRFAQPPAPEAAWRSDPSKKPDFRFVRADGYSVDEIREILAGDDAGDAARRCAVRQYVGRFVCPAEEKELGEIVWTVADRCDLKVLAYLLRSRPVVAAAATDDGVPRDLLHLG